jgi:hypothetical protein
MQLIEDTQLREPFPAQALMGIFILEGAVDSPNAAAAKVRDLTLDPTRIPDFTLIAESPIDAAGLLVSDGDVRAALSIVDAEVLDAGVLGQGRIVAITMSRASPQSFMEFIAYVGRPSPLVLSDLLAHVPSPFSGEVGVLALAQS